MDWVLLVLLVLSLAFNILGAIVLVRTREYLEAALDRQGKDVERLTKELLFRLPPMPYGVDIQDRHPHLTIGPYDGRIPM